MQQGKSAPATYCFTRSQPSANITVTGRVLQEKVLIVLVHTSSSVVELDTELGIHSHIMWILVKYRRIKSSIIVTDVRAHFLLGE
jgi:hypothetical protein